MEEKLHYLKRRVDLAGARSMLQQIDDKKTDTLAQHIGFDLVEGRYYRAKVPASRIPSPER